MLRSGIRLESVRRQDLRKEEMKSIMNNFIIINFTRNREGDQIQEHEISSCESGLYIPARVRVHSTHSTHTTIKKRLAIMLQSDPRWIPEEWLFRPHFTLWPPQIQRAVLWVLAQFVGFRSQLERNLTFQDYIDFLRRSMYKFYRKRNRITGWAITLAFSK